MDSYEFQGMYIPEDMMGGIRRYIDDKCPPGHFLTAVLENDLKEAVSRADHRNMKVIPAYVSYLYNHAPGNCWGSKEAVDEWLKG